MDNQKPSKMAVEARDCMERAVHDELVKKAKLGQDVIVNREGKPYKISAVEALRIQEEDPEYKA
ncbi:MAG: hypothetical protein K9M54_08175 [Kiritimatiellales bacterium]|nr:hypothetical protein [Kiritimatiellales bacterium]